MANALVGSNSAGMTVEPGATVRLVPVAEKYKDLYFDTKADEDGRWYKVIENPDHLPVKVFVKDGKDWKAVQVWDSRARRRKLDTETEGLGWAFEGAMVDLMVRNYRAGDASGGVDPDHQVFKVKSANAA